MFQTKVVFGEGHKKVSLIWPWVALLKLDQGYIFLKMEHRTFYPRT